MTAPGPSIQDISVKDLRPCPANPRKRRNAEADQELLDSIKARGVLSPIIARALGGKLGFEIGAGHRRWEMAKAAGLVTVPTFVRPFTDDEFDDLVLIENLQHDSLHPLDEAEGYSRLMEAKSLDIESLAGLVNKKVPDVLLTVKLLDLSADAREAFDAGRIDVKAARLLCRLQPADQEETLTACSEHEKRKVGRRPTVAMPTNEIRAHIENQLQLNLAKAAFDLEDTELVPAAGSCLNCPKRSGANVALFADIKDKDRCFDRSCFHAKTQAFIARVEAELTAAGTAFKGISLNYQSKVKGLLGSNEYRLVTGKNVCPDTVVGLVKELGWNEGVLGKKEKICANADCRVHSNRYKAPPTPPAERAKTRVKNLEVKRNETIRQSILDQTIGAIAQDGAQLEDLKLAVRSYFGRYWYDAKRAYFKRKGVEVAKSAHGGRDFDKTFNEYVLKPVATVKAAQALLMDIALHFDIQGNQRGSENALAAAAERHGVDVKAIQRSVTKEFVSKITKAKQSAKPKAKPAATKKPAKKKGKA